MINCITTHAVRDLRVTLNEAQDFGQEALVLVKRAIESPDDERFEFFTREAVRFSVGAANRARTFASYVKEFGKVVAK